MSAKDNGGPAFPISDPFSVKGPATEADALRLRDGMTLRDYFIAHAPSEPQPWFRPEMPPRPPRFPLVSEDGLFQFETVQEAEKTVGDCWTSVNQKAIDEWEADYQKQQYIQWPAAWADAMLEKRQ